MAAIRPGPRNLITDVAGLAVGNAEDGTARTGVTVLLPADRCVAAVDVRGGGPGTRETDALDPSGLVEAIDAVVLSGGSVFGLEAASGAVAFLAAAGRGFPVRGRRVPIVPAAILFDLANGGDKDWGAEPPYRRLGEAACRTAGPDFALGNAGAGLGGKAAGLKAGLGSASAVDGETGCTVGALAAVNAIGAAVMPGQDSLWAWMLEQDGEMGGQPLPVRGTGLDPGVALPPGPGGSTTLAIVATDAVLTKPEARRLAVMAQDGLARALRPAHTPFDGDTVFALATATRTLPEGRPQALARLGAIAADTLARAIGRAVYLAEPLGGVPAYRQRHGHALGRR